MNGFHYFSRCSSLSFPPGEDGPQPQDPSRLATLVGTSALFLFLAGPYLGPLFNLAAHHLWNLFVYTTPYWIVAAFDTETKNSSESHISRTHPTFYEKERAMRRIIGLDRSALDAVLSRRRRFSSLGHFSSPSRNLVPPGLGNWDNSCYQNSVIQGLASFRYFANYLDRNLRHLDSRRPLPTHHALRNILNLLNDPRNHGQKLWIPAELKSMSSWQQQDAQEYFSKLADQLEKEVREASKIITTNSGLSKPGRQESCLGIAGSTSAGDDNEEADAADVRDVSAMNIVHNPLEGLLAQRVGCIRCGWTEGLSLIPFNCLTVTLGREREYDVRDCLNEYMGLETIEGVECAKCTLLRAQDQLQNLVKQIDDDENIVNGPQSATVSSTLKRSAQTRLQAVQEALDDEDFTDKALSKKCHIPAKNRVSVTKSRQAVVARAPKNLVIHVNRSVFDEETGSLRKNHADVRFPGTLDLGEWCLGTRDVSAIKEQEYTEIWNTNPQASMLPKAGESSTRKYELRAVLTHFGRHENGHYICYRRFSTQDFPAGINEYSEEEKLPSHQWFRLSDEDVRSVSEQTIFNQGGVFMLFYESVDESPMDGEVLNHDLRVWNGPESKSFSKPGEQNDEGNVMQDALTSHGSDTSDSSLESDYSSARLTRTSSTNSRPSDEPINVQELSEAGGAPA